MLAAVSDEITRCEDLPKAGDKGQHGLHDMPWQTYISGKIAIDRSQIDICQERVAALGLGGDVAWTGRILCHFYA